MTLKLSIEPNGAVSGPGTVTRVRTVDTAPMFKMFWTATVILEASITTNLTVNVPGWEYACDTVAPEPVEPSPKSHPNE